MVDKLPTVKGEESQEPLLGDILWQVRNQDAELLND